MGGRNKKKKKAKQGGAKQRAPVLEGAAAVNEELRRVAGEMGLDFDEEDIEVPQKKQRMNESDDGAGTAKEAKSYGAGTQLDKGRSEAAGLPQWLMLEPGDDGTVVHDGAVGKAIGKHSGAPTPPVVAARLARLSRAVRLSLGLPSGLPRDLPLASRLLALLRRLLSELPTALGHKLNVAACKEAAAEASESCARLQASLEKQAREQASAAEDKSTKPEDSGIEEEGDVEERRDELPVEAARAWVEMICAVDELYYNLFYVCRITGASGKIPAPAEYHESVLPPGGVGAALQHLEAVRPEWSAGLGNAMAALPGGEALLHPASQQEEEMPRSKTTKKKNAGSQKISQAEDGLAQRGPGCCELQRILDARRCEGLWLFLCTGLAASLELKYKRKRKNKKGDKAAGEEGVAAEKDPTQQEGAAAGAASGRMVEPLAPGLLSRWRASARHWPARLYSFAVPCEEALQEMAAHAPFIEVGAGTGYWASLLRHRGVKITPYDTAPPSESQWNAYHGQVPPFVSVQKGGPDALIKASLPVSLFLCYPPPGSAMARRCLDTYKGSTVLHVGEWGGMTGDADFEERLIRDFKLVKVVPLPNWANTCYSLTVWSRRSRGVAEDETAQAATAGVLACSECSGRITLQEGRRSALCHQLVYCSQDCADDHSDERDAVARMLLLPIKHKRSHFEGLKAGAL